MRTLLPIEQTFTMQAFRVRLFTEYPDGRSSSRYLTLSRANNATDTCSDIIQEQIGTYPTG